MSRLQSRYVCQSCGATSLRWEGQCHACGAWNTLVETLVRDERATSKARRGPTAPPHSIGLVPLSAVDEPDLERLPVGIAELDRVLGGGIVPGSLVLLGGEPGIGKSTLALQVAAGVALRNRVGSGGAPAPVVYVSGEESPRQVRLRAQRLALDTAAAERVAVLPATELERIEAALADISPALVVVDSIQTLTVDGLDGPAGSVGQVRESAARLLRYAKTAHVPVLLVGHVTKDGSLAGPKTLEHLVDAVLTLDGERLGQLRLLRATKNRFGATDEIGVFEMVEAGLREVDDPARAFLGPAQAGVSGAVIAATLEGRRPLLAEVQALVSPAGYGPPRRAVSGLDANRLNLLLAVLGRRAGVGLGTHDVYASVAGGLNVDEPALDLPLAIALTSSLRDTPVVAGTVACGEIGLLGELRPVAGLERRLREAERLGFRRAIVPAADGERGTPTTSRIGALEVLTRRTLRDAISAALGGAAGSQPEGSAEASRTGARGRPTVAVGPG